MKWGLLAVPRTVIGLLRRRFTVMLVPHSEKRLVSIRVNAFVVLLGLAVVTFVISLFFYVSTLYAGSTQISTQREQSLEESRQELEVYQSEASRLRSSAQQFQSYLRTAAESLDIDGVDVEELEDQPGDFADFTIMRDAEGPQIVENLYIDLVSTFLQRSQEPIAEIGTRVEEEAEMLSVIPVLWPLADGEGRVALTWGPAEHPVTGRWHMHRGVSIWHVPGYPVVSSADGEVRRVDYDPHELGLFIEIEHGLGFRTRYAHLDQAFVRAGDSVTQGQHIGALGDTGAVAEPQLEFEVWIGTETVDPGLFLSVQRPSSLAED